MRKILTSAVAALAAVTLTGCNQTLDFRNADISNNKIYESGANSGFTGKVTNIPLSKIPFSGIVPVSNMIGKATGNKSINDYIYLNSLAVVKDGGVLCDTNAIDGVLNGETLCKISASNTPILKLTFKKNSIDGKVSFFYPQKSGQLFAEAIYKDGQAAGKLIIYAIASGNPIYKLDWLNGSITGEEEIIDEKTGKTAFKGNLVNGQYEGETVKYDSNGNISEKTSWEHGSPRQNSPLTKNAAPQACVDLWIAAFRKENGNDAAVSVDQITEWEQQCSQDKKPQS